MKKMLATLTAMASTPVLAHPGHPEAQWLLHEALHSNENLLLVALLAVAAVGGLLYRRSR